jgi:GNAT superfamily N-acetyltransferase
MVGDPSLGALRATVARYKMSLLRDRQACIPLTRVLDDGDILVLLSPVVRPGDNTVGDPFEPLGRALATRHPWVRHIPYTADHGITGYHVAFIKRAKAVIYVISGLSSPGQTSQADMAEVAQALGEYRPQIIVACHDVQELGLMDAGFPTIIELPAYAPEQLREAAAILFGEIPPVVAEDRIAKVGSIISKDWEVEDMPSLVSSFNFDFKPILDLWNQCLPEKFHLDLFSLRVLLDRDGFGKHYMVKEPETGELIGFCATYTTWAFSDPEYLVGSLAVLLVKPTHRRKGVGRCLHNHAIDSLRRTRGVRRLQLGSTFPRLLCGVPLESDSHEWFTRHGWEMDFQSAGRGQEMDFQSAGRGQVINDWLLRIQDWPSLGSTTVPEGFSIRQCNYDEFPSLLQFVRNQASNNETMGLFEEYKWSRENAHDIVLCLHGATIVAAALIYTAQSGTTAETDLPWARKIGFDVGGITCICIAGELESRLPYLLSLSLSLCVCVSVSLCLSLSLSVSFFLSFGE